MDPQYKELLDRIIKGAEFIANINEQHPQWETANERYDQLCEEAMRKRWTSFEVV